MTGGYLGEGLLACPRCGAIVHDPQLHDAWHDR